MSMWDTNIENNGFFFRYLQQCDKVRLNFYRYTNIPFIAFTLNSI